MSLPVALLAGGLATRLHPLTEHTPKSLIDVAGRPFVVRQLELLHRKGITDVVLCAGYLGEQLPSALGDGSRWNMRLQYVFDGGTLLGTGGALRRALPFLTESFFVMYGDSYLDCDYAGIEKSFLASGKAGLMTVFRNEDQWDRSNVVFQDGRILAYNKREHTSDMHHIDYGLGALHARVFEAYPDGTVIDLTKIYQDLLGQNQLAGFEVGKRFYEIGSMAGLEETRKFFLTRGRV